MKTTALDSKPEQPLSNDSSRVRVGRLASATPIPVACSAFTYCVLSEQFNESVDAIACTTASCTSIDHRNQQYSIYALTDSSGNVSERYAYTAYGQPTFLNASATVQTSSAAGNRYTYTAREWDQTIGLHHFRARWMSGLSGRFLTRDPLGLVAGGNLFEFIGGHAFDGVDPTGLFREPPLTPLSHPRWWQVPPQRLPLPPHYIPPSVTPIGRGRVTIDFEKTNPRRCIFYSDPYPGVAGIDDIPINDGVRIPFRSIDDLLNTVETTGCCEVIFAGHQGGTRNPGGIEGMINCNPYDGFGLRLKIAMARCDGCSLVLAGCGGVTPGGENCRKSLAKDSGCDVFGSDKSIEIPVPPTPKIPVADTYCTLDSKKVGKRCPYGGEWELWPFKRYTPD